MFAEVGCFRAPRCHLPSPSAVTQEALIHTIRRNSSHRGVVVVCHIVNICQSYGRQRGEGPSLGLNESFMKDTFFVVVAYAEMAN